MSELPYMKLYIADYMGDTRHLSTEEHGAYLLLLMAMWRAGGELPDSPKTLARVAGVSLRRWHLVSPAVMALFERNDQKVVSKRLLRELQKARELSAKQSANAKSKPRKNKETAVAMAEPTLSQTPAKAQPNGSLPLPEPESIKRIEPNGSIGNGRAVAHSSEEQKAFDNWNTMAAELELPKAVGLTPERRRKLRPRLKEFGLAGWNRALRNLGEMPFCCGQNDRGWRVTFDWMLSPTNFTKILEKAYERTNERS